MPTSLAFATLLLIGFPLAGGSDAAPDGVSRSPSVGVKSPTEKFPREVLREINELADATQRHFRAAEFEAEIPLRKRAAEVHLQWEGPDAYRTQVNVAYRESAEAALRLPEQDRRELVEARRLYARGEDAFWSAAFEAGLPLYEQALAVHERLLGAEDAATLEIRWRAATAAMHLHLHPRESVDAIQEVAAAYERRYGEVGAGPVLNDLATSQKIAGDTEASYETYRRAALLVASGWGPRSTSHAVTLSNLASVCNTLRRREEAIEAATAAANVFRTKKGLEPLASLVGVELERVRGLAALGRDAEAADALRTAIEVAATLPAPRRVSIGAEVSTVLAECEASVARVGQAEVLSAAVSALSGD